MRQNYHSLSNKLADFQSIGCNFNWEGSVRQKYIELTFNFRGDYYYPKDNIYIWMPMTRWQCRDLQVVVLSIFEDKHINPLVPGVH